MAWDSTKVDGSPSDPNGKLNAVDWNSIVSYVKGIYSDIATHISTYHIANDDARLSNARTPVSHAHEESDITGLDTSLSGKSDTSHTHADTYEAKNANIQSHISSPHLALGETETTAYEGYKGQIAYHHALEAHAPADANNYVHPASHAPAIITQDTSNRFVTDAEKSTWNGKQAPATTLAGYGITDAEAKNANIQSHISSAHLALGETSSTAYSGDKGKIAYDYSQSNHSASTIVQTDSLQFVSEEEKETWNSKESGDPGIQSHLIDTSNPHDVTAAQVTQDTSNRFVSDTEKGTWNSKEPGNANIQSHISSAHAPATAEQNVQPDWNQATDTSDDYIKNKPALGTAATKNIPATGDASATEVVYGSDTRLTNSRTPNNHNLVDTTGHPASGLTTGHFLKATGATTYGFVAHGLTAASVGAFPAIGVYDAIVYTSGATITAIGPTGTVISTGANASTVIQAALDSLPDSGIPAHVNGSVYVCTGTYHIGATITIPRHASLILDDGCMFWISSDIDLIVINVPGTLRGGTLEVSQIYGYIPDPDRYPEIPYTHAVVTINGNVTDYPSCGGYLGNICIRNDEYTPMIPYNGTAILMQSIQTPENGCIWGFICENVQIYGFFYGVHLKRTGASTTNWINGNKFKNIRMWYTRRMVWFETESEINWDLAANLFDGLELQTGGAPTEPCIYCNGFMNWFRNTNIWDWNVTWGPAIKFETYSQYNLFEYMAADNVAGYITDLGIENRITTQYGLIRQNNVLPELGRRYHLARVLTAEGTDLQIVTNSNFVDSGASAGVNYQNIFYVFKAANETIVDLTYYKANTNGMFQLYVNGVLDADTTYDHYASSTSQNAVAITLTVALNPGWNTLNFVASGKNASSSSYFFMALWLRLR